MKQRSPIKCPNREIHPSVNEGLTLFISAYLRLEEKERECAVEQKDVEK